MPPWRPFKYDVGDAVRVSYTRLPLAKNYMEQNSTMVYFISSRYNRANINRYKLKDQQNKAVPGSFTEDQLVLTDVDADTEYRIEKIIRYKTINKVRHALVRWQNYPSSYDSWLPLSEIQDLAEDSDQNQ